MKWLAAYTVLASAAFCVYSIYYAVVGDNSPFWVAVVFMNVPIILFAALYLRGRK